MKSFSIDNTQEDTTVSERAVGCGFSDQVLICDRSVSRNPEGQVPVDLSATAPQRRVGPSGPQKSPVMVMLSQGRSALLASRSSYCVDKHSTPVTGLVCGGASRIAASTPTSSCIGIANTAERAMTLLDSFRHSTTSRSNICSKGNALNQVNKCIPVTLVTPFSPIVGIAYNGLTESHIEGIPLDDSGPSAGIACLDGQPPRYQDRIPCFGMGSEPWSPARLDICSPAGTQVSDCSINRSVAEVECQISDTPQLSKTSPKVLKSKLRIGHLNIHNMNMRKKLTFVRKYVTFGDIDLVSVLGLSEYTNEKSNLDRILMNGDEYISILSDKDTPRVALAVPKYIAHMFSLLETWCYHQDRDRCSDKVCQLIMFKLTNGNKYLIFAIVYLAPDARIAAKNALFIELQKYTQTHQYIIVMGDFNIDQTLQSNRDYINGFLGGILQQKISEVTRKADRKILGEVVTTESIIDLIFVDNFTNTKVEKVRVVKTTPSDHYLVEITINFSIPTVFTKVTFYRDPLRRPPFTRNNLIGAIGILQHQIEECKTELTVNTHSLGIAKLTELITGVLDRYCPMNSPKPGTRKIFRKKLSEECLKLQRYRLKILTEVRKAYRVNDISKSIKLNLKLKEITKKYTNLRRKNDKTHSKKDLNAHIKRCKGFWDFIKMNEPEKNIKQNTFSLSIQGKTGNEMANHMADFLVKRAFLVEASEIKENCESIPFPRNPPKETLFLPEKRFSIDELFLKGKKNPSLACGPDTISLRHIMDLMPAMKDTLQMICDKPLDTFINIDRNYSRCISKTKCAPKQSLDEKSQRPIVEANILPKYTSVNLFIKNLRTAIIPFLGDNQFSFPKRGSPIALINVLDTANMRACQKKKTSIILYDYSNAFCTYDHDVFNKIISSFNFSDKLKQLCNDFLKQCKTSIKMNDCNGYYISDEVDMGRGVPQGQIGADLFFAMINDGIEPSTLVNVFIDVTKYVDDFTKVIACDSVSDLNDAIIGNELEMKRTASSLGLMLNESKTKIVPLNVRDDLIKSIRDIHRTVKLLGFYFETYWIARKGMRYISTDPSADIVISLLNGICSTVITARKIYPDIMDRLDISTKLLLKHTSHVLAILYVYCSEAKWTAFCIAIRKVIRTAGLDYMCDRDTVYRLSIKLPPSTIAVRQVITIGLKLVDTKSMAKSESRYLAKPGKDDTNKPFLSTFQKKFNKLPYTLRHVIINLYNSNTPESILIIKGHLNDHFLVEYNGTTEYTLIKLQQMALKNIYSIDNGKRRKQIADERRQKRLASEAICDFDLDGSSKRIGLDLTATKRARESTSIGPEPPAKISHLETLLLSDSEDSTSEYSSGDEYLLDSTYSNNSLLSNGDNEYSTNSQIKGRITRSKKCFLGSNTIITVNTGINKSNLIFQSDIVDNRIVPISNLSIPSTTRLPNHSPQLASAGVTLRVTRSQKACTEVSKTHDLVPNELAIHNIAQDNFHISATQLSSSNRAFTTRCTRSKTAKNRRNIPVSNEVPDSIIDVKHIIVISEEESDIDVSRKHAMTLVHDHTIYDQLFLPLHDTVDPKTSVEGTCDSAWGAQLATELAVVQHAETILVDVNQPRKQMILWDKDNGTQKIPLMVILKLGMNKIYLFFIQIIHILFLNKIFLFFRKILDILFIMFLHSIIKHTLGIDNYESINVNILKFVEASAQQILKLFFWILKQLADLNRLRPPEFVYINRTNTNT